MAGVEGLAACFALLWLADRCRATVPVSPLIAKNSPQDCFLNAQTLSGSSPYRKKEPHSCDSFLLAGAEGLGLACRLGRCFCILRMQRSPPETRTPRHAPRALVQDLFLQKTDTFRHPFLSWQGQKDLNPRHVVLERKARFQLSRVLKYSPPLISHKNSTFRI